VTGPLRSEARRHLPCRVDAIRFNRWNFWAYSRQNHLLPFFSACPVPNRKEGEPWAGDLQVEIELQGMRQLTLKSRATIGLYNPLAATSRSNAKKKIIFKLIIFKYLYISRSLPNHLGTPCANLNSVF